MSTIVVDHGAFLTLVAQSAARAVVLDKEPKVRVVGDPPAIAEICDVLALVPRVTCRRRGNVLVVRPAPA